MISSEHPDNSLSNSNDSTESNENNIPCKVCGVKSKDDGIIVNWIQCERCYAWFHILCVKLNEYDVQRISKYYCNDCGKQTGETTEYKPTLNQHRYDRTIADPDKKLATQIGTTKFIDDLKKKKFKSFNCIVKEGKDLTSKYLKKNGFSLPILVEEPTGLQMELPQNFTFETLIDALGENKELEVIDVNVQELENISLGDFIKYFTSEDRPKIYNCISLELSKTKLASSIVPPKIVSKLSWADQAYEEKDRPEVSKYCLLSMSDSYTDFHIDFSATSVWYHVVKGSKRFFFIEPTDENIDKYEAWQRDDKQNEIFFPDLFGDQCYEKCFEYTLKQGNTMFIPAGWIHAVLTPEDSMVFGGNFLQAYGADLQIKVFKNELKNGYQDKFKYPLFKLTHWLATDHVYKFLKDLYECSYLTRESVKDNPIYARLFRCFKDFRTFTIQYHEEMKLIATKLGLIRGGDKINDKLTADEIKQILHDSQFNDVEEFKAEYKTYKIKNYSTLLRNMKRIYLDNLSPDGDIDDENDEEKTIAAELNNSEFPQKTVKVMKKKKDRNDGNDDYDYVEDESLLKRFKLEHDSLKTDSTNLSSSKLDHHFSTAFESNSDKDSTFIVKRTNHHNHHSNNNNLPISQVYSSLKIAKHQTASSSLHSKCPFKNTSLSNKTMNSALSINSIQLNLSTNFPVQLSNFKIPKKKPVQLDDTHEHETTNSNPTLPKETTNIDSDDDW